MKHTIIGITGRKESGKDTIASMFAYINIIGATKAYYSGYAMWYKQKQLEGITIDNIIHFADKLKDCLSILYNIDRNYFDNRKYKDELYYNPKEKRFIKESDIISEITTEHYNIEECIKHGVFKLRELLQYFGTDVCRKHLGDNIWIDSCMFAANDIANKYGICIVSDVRFENEADAIRKSSLYGGLIKVIRSGIEQNNHTSETSDIKADYVIENNSNIFNLFYKVLNIYNDINNKRNLKV